ncbi:MAG: proline racemase family protein, partial [Anaerolineales bacterium]|nr:proline racemase family protein [Anaerolineales bacterium]
SIGVITAAIEFGMVDAVEPVTKVVLDTPAGLVTGYAKMQGGTIESVSIRNVPSFLYKSISVDLPHISSVPMDIAYGGVFFTIIDASVIGTTIDLNNASRLLELAAVIKEITNSRISVNHPQKAISTISGVRFYSKLREDGTHIRNLTIVEGAIDRSPCGAGTSAHLAALHTKGQIGLGQECIHESIVGTTFKSTIVSKTKVDGFDAVIPEITGNAYTMGINTLILSPNDPLKHGFLI